MPILELTPHTCSDNFYSMGREQPTSMKSLSNLVPAPDSMDEWVPRPAAALLPGSDVYVPGFVSCQLVVGSLFYGMVSSATNTGHDEPFCYDLVAQAVIAISGITAANTPTSPNATGAWTPPHMELVGVKIIVTHTGFPGTTGKFFGSLDVSTPTSPTWAVANTAINPLPSVPVWCTEFGGRAYFFVNPAGAQPGVVATDALDPLTVTNGSFVLTFGDNIPLLCGGTLAYTSQLQGIQQSLIVFKAHAVNMFQVTGDFALQTTAINSLNIATGTLASNSVVATPKGIMFVAPDGLRLIDYTGIVSDPIGVAGSGVSVPFIYAVVPSRICAASNATTIRISTQNGVTTNNAQEEWCYDFARQIWHGPHTFPVSIISAYGISFIASQIGAPGLFQTDVIPNTGSLYLENGAIYVCEYHSGRMPERAGVNELSSVKAIFYQGAGVGTTTYTITAFDDADNVLDIVGLSFFSTVISWDHFIWGSGALLGTSQSLSVSEIPWAFPIVFDRMSIRISTTAASGIRLGKFLMEYNPTGYTAVGPVQGQITFTTPPPVPPVILPPTPPPPPGIDPGLPALLACMGSLPSPARQTLMNNALAALRTAGLLAKLDVLYVFAVEAADQSLCNWVNPATFHAVAHGSPAFTADRGYIGGAGAYVDTTWTPSTDAVNYTLDDASAFAWSPTSGLDTGVGILSNTGMTLQISVTGSSNIQLNDGTGNLAAAAGQSNGLVTGVRTATAVATLHLNNTAIDSSTRTSTSVPASPIHAASVSGLASSMMGAGASLSVPDIAALYSIFATYFTAIGCPL